MIYGLNKEGERIHIQFAVNGECYVCPLCGTVLTLKNHGEKKAHHFAHKANVDREDCEMAYYDMSDWHISWQNLFPKECQEKVLVDMSGKKHIADVLYENTVIEFQHSQLSKVDFEERNEFYCSLGYKVFWLFDCRETKMKQCGENEYTLRGEMAAIQAVDKCDEKNVEVFLEFEGENVASKDDDTAVIQGIKKKDGLRYSFNEQIDVEELILIMTGGTTYDALIEQKRLEEEKRIKELQRKEDLKRAKVLRRLLGACPEERQFLTARNVITDVVVKIENTDEMLEKREIVGKVMVPGYDTFSDKMYPIKNQKEKQWVIYY